MGAGKSSPPSDAMAGRRCLHPLLQVIHDTQSALSMDGTSIKAHYLLGLARVSSSSEEFDAGMGGRSVGRSQCGG